MTTISLIAIGDKSDSFWKPCSEQKTIPIVVTIITTHQSGETGQEQLINRHVFTQEIQEVS